MKRLKISQKLVYEVGVVKKLYVHEIAAVNLSTILLPEKRKRNM